ncbi:MAG: hypothetical protein PVI30_00360 [Myxococcales bacterium]
MAAAVSACTHPAASPEPQVASLGGGPSGTAPSAETVDAPAVPDPLPRPEDPTCPPDPELARQFELLSPEDPTAWPVEVRLRLVIRQNGDVDCPVVIGATHPDFVQMCLDMVEGGHHAPIGEPEPRDTWVTFLCTFDPKSP